MHKYGISLNPKKSFFSMREGKLLVHIVSKEGVNIDPERVKSINTIGLSRNKKEVQSFLGKLIFLRRFIPNFVDIMKSITDMLKKDTKIKCTFESRDSFEYINKTLGEAPVLFSHDYDKPFLIFSFASENTISVVLQWKNTKK